MAKAKESKTKNPTDHPYDNGAIGAIGSVASAGLAVGAALGAAVGLPEIIIGAVFGGVVGAVGSVMVADGMDHPAVIPPKKTD